MSDSLTLIKLKILRVVAESEGTRSPQLQQRVFLSSSQLRRYTEQLESAGLLVLVRQSDLAKAFAHYLGPNALERRLFAACEALEELDNGISDLKRIASTSDDRIVQLERRVKQLFDEWQ